MIDELFDNLEIIEVNLEIAELVISYRKKAKKKIKLPDAIILATSNYLGAALFSDDWDDFTGIDTNVNIVAIDEYKI